MYYATSPGDFDGDGKIDGHVASGKKEVSLAEVIRLFDGPLAPTDSVSEYFYASTPVEKEKKLLGVFRRIRDQIAQVLERTTLADVL